MIRMRRVYGAVLPIEADRVRQVQEIFRASYPDEAHYADKMPSLLNQPFQFGYRTYLVVSESSQRKVTGFSLFLHVPEINSSLLDFLVVAPGVRGGGLGGGLYEATREYLQGLGSRGLFMEVLPDDPDVVRDGDQLAANRRRLRFYEQYGVRPIIGTEYETPLGPSPAPYLLFDGLGRDEPLRRSEARAATRIILMRKYSQVVPPEYIEHVVESFLDDPVRFRPARYVRQERQSPHVVSGRLEKAFAVVHTDSHQIHHVRDRGYVERPARVGAILASLEASPLFTRVRPRRWGLKPICAVHDRDFVTYLKRVCQTLPGARPVYPYVFPIRRPDRRPKELAMRAGYYCIDTFTPLDHNAYRAARDAVDVAVTAAEELLAGRRVAYALCRPPGHHAGRRTFGGFCYFNNAAVAAHRLSGHGTVAVLDVDFHHGNGTQDIFYARPDVLTVSIHGHPNVSYPFFMGFADERGEGSGEGYNLNLPLPENTAEPAYLQALDKALHRIRRFDPAFLVLSLGFDTLRGDPTGAFLLRPGSLQKMGRRLGALNLPLLVVQEGGYSLRNLRRAAHGLFEGIADALAELCG